DFLEGNHFFLFVERDFKPSVASWIKSMFLWPLCFIVTCQEILARGKNLLQTSTAFFWWPFRPQVCCLPKALEASESHIAPQRGLAQMLSLPDTDNMQGTQTMDGMWTLDPPPLHFYSTPTTIFLLRPSIPVSPVP
ncbi:hypothetical protein KUCAC02_005974, partial [Chaenocephalus aceratus]